MGANPGMNWTSIGKLIATVIGLVKFLYSKDKEMPNLNNFQGLRIRR